MAPRVGASAYADEGTVLLMKQKVWSPGPLYMDDAPWQRFALDDLTGIQKFLVDILTSPINGVCPEPAAHDLSAIIPRVTFQRRNQEQRSLQLHELILGQQHAVGLELFSQ
jgi:hypothetical protein